MYAIVMPEETGNQTFFVSEDEMINLTLQVRMNLDVDLDTYDLDDFIYPLREKPDAKKVFVIRMGGIGDVIALSALVNELQCSDIVFQTLKRYAFIPKLFTKKVKVLTDGVPAFLYDEHIAKDIFDFAQVNIEGLIERAGRKNWYEVFFETAGIPFKPEYGRPKLNYLRKNYKSTNIDKSRFSILICAKSSSKIRTINHKTIVECLPEKIKRTSNIHIHDVNIKAESIKQFLADVYDADLVISVDTAALHFREAVQKPAIGLYNAFSKDCRTKYYKYTKSFDVPSDCELQPCHLHTRNDDVCPNFKAKYCFGNKRNPKLTDFLKKLFENEITK